MSSSSPSLLATAFLGKTLFAQGELPAVALQVKARLQQEPQATLLVFNNADGRVIDLDLRGSDADMLARLPSPAPSETAVEEAAQTRGPGRPKLGVVAREVTLLPRHWEWLAAQPGGASVALRKLVEEASRSNRDADLRRQAQEAAYRFMSAMAGDEAGFEEATRALFAGQKQGFIEAQSTWSRDVSAFLQTLALKSFVDP